MTNTTYYNLNIAEGTDIVNPLTVDNPNYEKIDEVMHNNSVAGVTLATELTNSTIHALTRENSDCSVIRFIATSQWKAGDSVTVDGVPVLALLPSGETLPDGAYVINANVLCVLTGTNLTVYVGKKAEHASEIAYNATNVEQELNSLNDSMVTVNSDLSTLNSNLTLDYSNSSMTNLNGFLQAMLDRFYPKTKILFDNGNGKDNWTSEKSGDSTVSIGTTLSLNSPSGVSNSAKVITRNGFDLSNFNTLLISANLISAVGGIYGHVDISDGTNILKTADITSETTSVNVSDISQTIYIIIRNGAFSSGGTRNIAITKVTLI